MPSIVYILTNPSMPDSIEIGTSDNIQEKMESLYEAHVPEPFQCFYAGEVENAESTEQHLHELFADCRVSSKRNFFRIDPQRVLHALRLANPIDVTPEKNGSALKKREVKRRKISFSMVKIPVGATLTFRGDQAITCKVVGDREIEFEGEVCSVGAAAQKILRREWVLNESGTVSGPTYWRYENENLYSRRKRMENDS